MFNLIIEEYNNNREGFEFTNKAKDIMKSICIKGIISQQHQPKFEELYSDDLETRVNFIYNSTFGAPNQIDFFTPLDI